ncbi:M10 family metallopeptidase C-terminal domain-containing protein [Tritonibacter mobilis]|uniref:M10 family metallopeptidase C-terminal domain-containing protein n=1 Tax=Tritonibacter mobilis TaxID=379347 RepID=UPI0039A5858C
MHSKERAACNNIGGDLVPSYPSSFLPQSIANNLTREGRHWDKTTITFSFDDTLPTSGGVSSVTLDTIQRSWINEAIALLEDVIDVDFVQVTSGGDISFNGVSGTSTYTQTFYYLSSGDITSSDVYLSQERDENLGENLSYGNQGFQTIIHELLHTVGLLHPSDYGNYGSDDYFLAADFREDTIRHSIMSYFDPAYDGSGSTWAAFDGASFSKIDAQTMMVYDILALSEGSHNGLFSGYGLNLTTRAGNTTYGYNATNGIRQVFNFDENGAPALTIYDAGGIDTLDLSGDDVSKQRTVTYAVDGSFTFGMTDRVSAIIDLTSGAYSSTHGMTNNIGIAFGTIIENAIGTVFRDNIKGNGSQNQLHSGRGDDTIFGMSGDDHIHGGSGNDLLLGGLGADALDGGEGIDRAQYSDALSAVSVDLLHSGNNSASAAGDTFTSVENLFGSGYSDTLKGDGADNWIWGWSGGDTLFGRDGDDILYGGSGNDIMLGGRGADLLDGGDGVDRAQYSDALTRVGVDFLHSTGNIGEAAGDAYVSIENIFGSGHGDDLRADNDDNAIWGWIGDDILYGRDGNDYLSGGSGNDTLSGAAGSDTLFGGSGADLLYGGNGDGSEDTFLFSSVNDSQAGQRDVVFGFVSGVDAIDLKGIDANANLSADQNFTYSSSASANSVWIDSDGQDLLVRGDVDGDGVSDFEIKVFGLSGLSASDFIL